MLTSASSEKGPATMVTLVTERLQQQRLTDSPCRTHSVSLGSTETESQTGNQSFHSIHGDWNVAGQSVAPRAESLVRTVPLPVRGDHAAGPGERVGSGGAHGWPCILSPSAPCRPSLALPTKRHCRSLSESDKLLRCRSPWKPGSGSGVWTTVSQHRDGDRSPEVTTFIPRPSSASSGFADGSERSDVCSPWSSSSAPHRSSDGSPCCCFSVSQELLDAAVLAPLPRPRCHSQPSELQEHRNRLKRRRGEGPPWTRPALDFLKMTRTLKSSRSLCSLDYEDTGDPEMDPEMALSPSARDPAADPAGPGVSLAADQLSLDRHHTPHLKSTAALSESDEEASDSERTEAAAFPLECGDLDLEEIENN
ncbi:protein FAM53A-like [Brienomyrus brachyistius]|uniref:protein FAM53A-like n=1 Tax=Brienomyrus brachyistius TaxID=42636 RepID=UPI0020B1BED1|nr:protein FAM53A-like [Brienomyrus brachyistius]XP_048851943.1 protein FAM53A-like [Brienomyrus brachyistius]